MKFSTRDGLAFVRMEDPNWSLLGRSKPIEVYHHWFYVEKLYSLRPYRSGVGKQLLKKITKWADERGAGLWLTALAAGDISQHGLEELYKSFGFQKHANWTKIFTRLPRKED